MVQTNVSLRRRTCSLLTAVLFVSVIVSSATSSAANTELRFLAVDYSPQLMLYLKAVVIPEFEAKHGAQVVVDQAGWDNRMDKILVALAAGRPYDVVVTAYYSRYEESTSGILAPLDDFIADWDVADKIPAALWESLKWDGRSYVIPQMSDIRGMAYNKRLFAEAGLDPDTPPQSWQDLVAYTRRLTRMSEFGDDRVTQRGLNLSGTESGSAQQFFWFLRQAGLPEINVETFTSNLGTAEALRALSTLHELSQASHFTAPGPSGGMAGGRVAMEMHTPAHRRDAIKANPDIVYEYGLFAPRMEPDTPPVALAFINGLGISAASDKKELAWEFIATLYEEDILFEIESLTGYVSGHVDMMQRLMDIHPHIELFYDLFAHVQLPVVAPPRNIAQQELGRLILSVYRNEVPPEEALTHAHELWTRLLVEWREEIQGSDQHPQ